MANPNLVKQGEITKEKILNWLYEFKYSKAKILQKVSGISIKGVRKYLAKLEKNKWVISEKIPNSLEKVYGITREGIGEIGMMDKYRQFQLSKFNHTMSIHNFDLQELQLFLLKKYNTKMHIINPKTVIDSIRRPDGILYTHNNVLAFELERTTKSKERYKRIFGDYVQDLMCGKFTHVNYIITRKSALTVRKTFNDLDKIFIKNKMKTFDLEFKKLFSFSDFAKMV